MNYFIRLAVVASITTFAFVSAVSAGAGPATIVVDTGAPAVGSAPDHAFLHGFVSQPPSDFAALVTPLRPSGWRGYRHEVFDFARSLGAKFIVALADALAVRYGVHYQELTPWTDWASYEEEERQIVAEFESGRAPAELETVYWEIWSEPNHDGFWTGTVDQFEEWQRRAYAAMKSVDPNAKVIGLEWSVFDETAPNSAYPTATAVAQVARIPHDATPGPLLASDIVFTTSTFSALGGRLVLPINNFSDGYAYLVEARTQ